MLKNIHANCSVCLLLFFFFPSKPSARVGLWVAPAALRSPSPVQVSRRRGVGVGHPHLSPFRWTAALRQGAQLCWGPALGRIKIFWHSSPASSQGGCHSPSIPTAHQCNARGPSCHIMVPPSFFGEERSFNKGFQCPAFCSSQVRERGLRGLAAGRGLLPSPVSQDRCFG